MDKILASMPIDNSRYIHIAQLARQTIIDSGAAHLGFGGYFLFETHDVETRHHINILGKAASLEAAFRMIDIWQTKLA